MVKTNNSINSVIVGQSQLSAFGDLLTAERNSRIQLQFPYNINSLLVSTTTTGIGTVSHSDTFAVCSTGASMNSSATVRSKENAHYRPGQGIGVYFTALFTTGVSGSTQIVGIGDDTDGFFFGYNGTEFGILHRNDGVDTWTAQSSWNQDQADGTGAISQVLDPTKGNVYHIKFQWLGFGNIFFYVEDQDSGNLILVHNIQYPNTYVATSLRNPSLPLCFEAANTSGSSTMTVKVPSMGAFVEGPLTFNDLRFAINGSKSITTEVNLLTIQNKSTYQGETNKTTVYPDVVSFTVAGSKDCAYKLYLNTTLGGSPSYTDISVNQSVVSYDTAGTTVSGGTLVMVLFVNGNNELSFDLSQYNISLNAGDILTITGTSAGTAITSSVGISWRERV